MPGVTTFHFLTDERPQATTLDRQYLHSFDIGPARALHCIEIDVSAFEHDFKEIVSQPVSSHARIARPISVWRHRARRTRCESISLPHPTDVTWNVYCSPLCSVMEMYSPGLNT